MWISASKPCQLLGHFYLEMGESLAGRSIFDDFIFCVHRKGLAYAFVENHAFKACIYCVSPSRYVFAGVFAHISKNLIRKYYTPPLRPKSHITPYFSRESQLVVSDYQECLRSYEGAKGAIETTDPPRMGPRAATPRGYTLIPRKVQR